MKVRCRFCKSANIRSSYLRIRDWKKLLLLLMPVRCHRCGLRDHLWMRTVLHIRRAESRRALAHQRRHAMVELGASR